jgi:hypothetical protein
MMDEVAPNPRRLKRTTSELPNGNRDGSLRGSPNTRFSNLKNRARALESQLQEIKKLKLEIEAECQAASLAPKRLLKFQPKIGTEYPRPRCWIEQERRSSLRPVPTGTRDDMMKCSLCPDEYVIPDAKFHTETVPPPTSTRSD